MDAFRKEKVAVISLVKQFTMQCALLASQPYAPEFVILRADPSGTASGTKRANFLPSPALLSPAELLLPISSEMLRHSKIISYKYSFQIPFIISNISMEQVLSILKQHEAGSLASLEEKNIFVIEKRPGNAEPWERHRKFVEGTISNLVPEEKFNAIMTTIDELGIPADITQALPLGGAFGDYGQIDNVLDEGKTQLRHEAGEVLLVDVWATWCGPCQRPMQHNQEMLAKNEAGWAGKVRIVAVSVDEQKEVIAARVNGKGWTKIQHLTLMGWNGEHRLIKDFSISGIPFVCLVNKFGKINFLGHPSSINLEDRINQLIAQEKEEEDAPAAPAQAVTEVKKNQKLAALLTKDFIKSTFEASELLCVKGDVLTTLDKGVLSQKSSVQVYAFEHDEATIEKVKKEFEGLQGVELKVSAVKTVEVPYQEDPTCWECHAALAFPYYWLYWEQGTHFACVTCVEKSSAQENHHFNYEKNSVLLTGKWARIPLKGLGQNLQPEDVKTLEDGHQFGCNGCGGGSGLGQPRYICLGCRAEPNFRGDYVDLCQPCREKIGSEEMKEQLKNEHHNETHPLLRVLYCVKGYYDF